MAIALRNLIAFFATGAVAASFAFGACSKNSSTEATAGSAAGGSSDAAEDGSGGSSAGGSLAGGASGAPESGADSGAPDVPGATWELVPGSEFTGDLCQVYQAVPGTLAFPALTWSSCGDGCESTDPGKLFAQPYAWSASLRGGKAYLSFEATISEPNPWATGVDHLVRLEDGVTIAALAEHQRADDKGFATCFLSASVNDATILGLSGPAPSHLDVFGFAPLDGGPWTWAQPPVSLSDQPPGKSAFDAEARIFDIGAGGVFAVLDPTSTAWTTLETPSDAMFGGGEGDLAVWTESNSARIRGWAPDGKGVRTLVENAPNKTCLVQPSATEIVGAVFEGDCQSTMGHSVRVWHTPRTYDLVSAVSLTPVIAAGVLVSPTYQIRTRGDFAAMLTVNYPDGGTPDPNGFLIVVQLSTGKAWRIEAEPGYVVQGGSFVLDDTWLYFGETLPGASNIHGLSYMRRLRLDQLDVWGKPP